jgi:phosphatidate cytidylyltransferase
MLRQRVITAIVLAAGFLGALFGLPAAGWTLFAAGVLAAAAWEWCGLARRPGRWVRLVYAAGTVGAGLWLAWFLGLAGGRPGALSLIPVYGAAVAFWVLGAPWWLVRQPKAPPRGLILGVGWVVLIPTFLALVHLRNIHPVTLLVFMMLVWIADIAAYFAGRRFGHTQLAPSISPGKTREGLYGALAATTAFAVAWITLMRVHAPALVRDLPGSVAWMILLVAALTLLSVVGDLFESALKRQAGLKDSGSLLPGHGGVLDRIDALTPVLPAAALVCMI